MNNRERMLKIFKGEMPDRVPFMSFSELMPRGGFEREMRNRGMGLITSCTSLCSELENVEISTKIENSYKTTTYRTPVGEVSTRYKTHAGSISNDSSIQQEFLINKVEDYEPVIFMLDNTKYSINEEEFKKIDLALGDDGLTHVWTDEPPYMDCQYYMGLEKWSYEQYDHPDEFHSLMQALGRRQDRRLKLLLDCPEMHLINLGNLAGNFGPEQYKEYILPYYRKYIPMFKERGKITTVHADASNLKEFKDIVLEHGVDVIEAFTPPPIGNLSLSEARKTWGENVIIHINFPEPVFYEGYAKTKQYTIDLLKSDPSFRKFIGFTEMGLMALNENNADMFKNGVTAIMDAIDECGIY